MSKFWMVWSPEGFPPRFRHETDTLAKAEASRLKSEYPEKAFYVLEAIAEARVATPKPPVEIVDLDELPF